MKTLPFRHTRSCGPNCEFVYGLSAHNITALFHRGLFTGTKHTQLLESTSMHYLHVSWAGQAIYKPDEYCISRDSSSFAYVHSRVTTSSTTVATNDTLRAVICVVNNSCCVKGDCRLDIAIRMQTTKVLWRFCAMRFPFYGGVKALVQFWCLMLYGRYTLSPST